MFKILLEDAVFRELNIPILPEARRELEERIAKNMYVAPIPVWNDYILTGFEQHDLCQKYHRLIATRYMNFHRRNEAIAWICREQLSRTDLNAISRVWLISRLYESVRKTLDRRDAWDQFQYKQLSPSRSSSSVESPSGENMEALRQLGNEYHCHMATIRRYCFFGRQLDRLEEKVPGIRNSILTGKVTVSLAHLKGLLQMSPQELQLKLNDPNCRVLKPPEEILEKTRRKKKARRKKKVLLAKTNIKQMPAYDPDAEANGLTFTIEAWEKALIRVREKSDLHSSTLEGRSRLMKALSELREETDSLYLFLEGEKGD